MRKLNARSIMTANRQAGRVKNEARIVIHIDQDDMVSTWKNPDGRIKVIAVVGPLVVKREIRGEYVLLEIGMGRTRPYRKVFGSRDADGRRLNRSEPRVRLEGARISTEQLHLVWTALSQALKSDALHAIYIKGNGLRKWAHQFKGKEIVVPQGPRYSCSFDDVFVCAMALRSEMATCAIDRRAMIERIVTMIKGKFKRHQAEAEFTPALIDADHKKGAGSGLDFLHSQLDVYFRPQTPHIQWMVWLELQNKPCADLFKGMLEYMNISLDVGKRCYEEYLETDFGVPYFTQEDEVAVRWVPFLAHDDPRRHVGRLRADVKTGLPAYFSFEVVPLEYVEPENDVYDGSPADDIPF